VDTDEIPARPRLTAAALATLAITTMGGCARACDRPIPAEDAGTAPPAIGSGLPMPVPVPPAVEAVVRGYLTAAKCGDRLPFILDGEKNRDTLRAHYGRLENPCASRIDEMQGTPGASCDAIQVGEVCTVHVWKDSEADSTPYLLERRESGFLVDWRATAQPNLLTFKELRERRPTGATTLRVWATASDYYGFQWSDARATHVAVTLDEPRSRPIRRAITGYLPRAPDGARLAALLADGQRHPIVVSVKHKPGGQPELVDIVKLFRLDWRSSPEELVGPE